MSKLIDSLTLPSGLRGLSDGDLNQVCHELREDLIDTISQCGGHFASSLGVTELTVMLHSLFETPKDRIIFDTGHQGYIHKMLTGRRSKLSSIRQKDGLSGFLKRSESEFDVFGAGHAGTSISAAAGINVGLRAKDPSRYTVAVIGDGSMTSGMVFEAMNHAGALGLQNFIVMLNDNEMSISPNVGALSWLFSRVVTSSAGNVVRNRFKNLYRQGYVPELVYKMVDRSEEATQMFFSPAAALFGSFGFRYIGPVDGHNVTELRKAIEHAKTQDVPTLVHCFTTKGRGYKPAEGDPLKWHGVTPFDRSEAAFKISGAKVEGPSYTAVFGATLREVMAKNEKVVAVTAAMPTGTGVEKLQSEFPSRVFDVGIAEQHAVTFAAGLACEGLVPFVAIYSTFLQRAYDQILHDVSIQKLPVVFAMDRAGVVGNDGETHHGVFDISFLRSIPHMVLMAPKDENEFRHMINTSAVCGAPVGLRYPRGNGTGVAMDPQLQVLPIGRGEVLRRGRTVALVGYGAGVQIALKAADLLRDLAGIEPTVVNARFAKPLDESLLVSTAENHELVITIEDHAVIGGFGSAVHELYAARHIGVRTRSFGVQDEFVPHASQSDQIRANGYDAHSIAKEVAGELRSLGLGKTGRMAVA